VHDLDCSGEVAESISRVKRLQLTCNLDDESEFPQLKDVSSQAERFEDSTRSKSNLPGRRVRPSERSSEAMMQHGMGRKVTSSCFSAHRIRSRSLVRGTVVEYFCLLLCRLLCICACNEKTRSAGGSLLRLTKQYASGPHKVGSATLRRGLFSSSSSH
jgi:hypothetical protein